MWYRERVVDRERERECMVERGGVCECVVERETDKQRECVGERNYVWLRERESVYILAFCSNSYLF